MSALLTSLNRAVDGLASPSAIVDRLLEQLGAAGAADLEAALDFGHAYELARHRLGEAGAAVPAGLAYTPAPLARQLAARVAERAPTARVALDPACGAGALLLAWLEARPGGAALGRDVDGDALRLAEALVTERTGRVDAGRFEWADLFEQGGRSSWASVDTGADVLLLNPPFGTNLSGPAAELAGSSRLAGREPDAFALALERVLERAGRKPLGAIVPDVVRMQGDYTALRRHVTGTGRLREVVQGRFGDFEGRTVQPCLLVLDGAANPAEPVHIELAGGEGGGRAARDLLADPDCRWRADEERLTVLWARCHEGATALGELAACHEGVHTGNVRAKLFTRDPGAPAARPLFKGADIHPFRCTFRGRYLRYDPALIDRGAGEYASLRDPAIFRGPKLLSRQTTSRLIVAIDPSDAVTDNTLHTISPRGEAVTLEWLALVLNSELMTRLYRFESGEGERPLPQVKLRVLRRLPIRPPRATARRVAELHDRARAEGAKGAIAPATRAAIAGIVFDSYQVPESDRDWFR